MSAHVGHLARSGTVAVDQLLDGDHVIARLECALAEGAVGSLRSGLACLSFPYQKDLFFGYKCSIFCLRIGRHILFLYVHQWLQNGWAVYRSIVELIQEA